MLDYASKKDATRSKFKAIQSVLTHQSHSISGVGDTNNLTEEHPKEMQTHQMHREKLPN